MAPLRCGSAVLAVLCAALWVVSGAEAVAQTVVQLPSYHVTSVNTTVSVPDRGGAYLGGVNSTAAGSVNSGVPGIVGRPFGNSAVGGTSTGGGMWVGAQVHDMQAMDEALLGQKGKSGVNDGARGAGRETSVASVADLKARAEAEDAARRAQGADELQQARRLAAAGKPGVAKIYFNMAAKHGGGDVQRQALAELQALSGTKTSVTDSGQATAR